jgi:hypothetical protein
MIGRPKRRLNRLLLLPMAGSRSCDFLHKLNPISIGALAGQVSTLILIFEWEYLKKLSKSDPKARKSALQALHNAFSCLSRSLEPSPQSSKASAKVP